MPEIGRGVKDKEWAVPGLRYQVKDLSLYLKSSEKPVADVADSDHGDGENGKEEKEDDGDSDDGR